MDDLRWWQRAVFYQIYPRSFADGNGDGIGDFPGINAKLDYLAELGIDAVWLSPHYPSPFLDCGYDISDYCGVAPEYGSLQDFVTFVEEAHARNIRVVLDLVLNHTSDQHPWFVESRSGRGNPKRDWYIWRDGRDGGPPNNWASIFGGSAWELDAATGQYYYHAFLKEQPDLNWRNPEVKAAMWDVVRFWLDLGVDGFRLDAIATVFEDSDLPDQTLVSSPDEIIDANTLALDDYRQLLHYQLKQPGLHDLLQELRALIDDYPGERVLIGEDEDVAFHGTGDDELHLVFNFPLMQAERLTPIHVTTNQELRLAALPSGAWPCNTLGNHDARRIWSRFGDGLHDGELARLHLALLLTLKGTPFLYNGEEIGMVDLELTELSQFRDTMALRQYARMTERMQVAPEEALRAVAATTRDRCRSPFQWCNAPNGGFSPAGVQSWLPVNSDYATGVNVADQEIDPASMLNFYRHLLRIRRATPALVAGDYLALPLHDEQILAFLRTFPNDEQRCLVLLNFSADERSFPLPPDLRRWRLLYSTSQHVPRSGAVDHVALSPFEVFLAEVI